MPKRRREPATAKEFTGESPYRDAGVIRKRRDVSNSKTSSKRKISVNRRERNKEKVVHARLKPNLSLHGLLDFTVRKGSRGRRFAKIQTSGGVGGGGPLRRNPVPSWERGKGGLVGARKFSPSVLLRIHFPLFPDPGGDLRVLPTRQP